MAYAKLCQQQEYLSSEQKLVHSLTLEDLKQSPKLRSLILNYEMTLFKNDPKPVGSFERTYKTDYDKKVVDQQRLQQTSLQETIDKRESVIKHNNDVIREYREDEPGLNKEHAKIDVKKFKA